MILARVSVCSLGVFGQSGDVFFALIYSPCISSYSTLRILLYSVALSAVALYDVAIAAFVAGVRFRAFRASGAVPFGKEILS